MDSTHAATGSITALIASALVYVSHWPLQPLDAETASTFAGLLVTLGWAAVKVYQARWGKKENQPVEPPAAPPAPPPGP